MGSATDVHVLQIVDDPRERLRVMAGGVVEAAFGVISQTHDPSLGLLVPHVVFAALAALTLAVGRLDAARLVWMTASAAVLLVSVIVTMVGGNDNVPILLVFSGYLALLTAVLVWHAATVRALGPGDGGLRVVPVGTVR